MGVGVEGGVGGSLLSSGCEELLSLPALCFLTPLELEILTLSLFLFNPLPVCL